MRSNIGVIRNAAARGAKLLDAKKAGWFKRINLRRLDLSNCHQCVLGQLYARADRTDLSRPGYFVGVEILSLNENRTQRYGFKALHDNSDDMRRDMEYRELDKAWSFEIGRRVNGRF